MFTGIVEELGTVVSLAARDTGARLKIGCKCLAEDLTLGASIAVNGACLTVIDRDLETFSCDLAPETLRRTSLGDLQPSSRVNLERPLRANGRLDGHFVLGHVDGTGVIRSLDALGDDNWWLRVGYPPELGRYIVSKGSLAVDGISLTVAEIDHTAVGFTIIPHTYGHTSIGEYRLGSRVNLEVDMLAKHLEKLASHLTVTPSARLYK
ncbi:MAG TPA: riboflavin synthase [Bryobacteraceae bacterium]|jgi:riboflavin synthase|nr:riboflavin synthase [Bryobacteraceae bacterium]